MKIITLYHPPTIQFPSFHFRNISYNKNDPGRKGGSCKWHAKDIVQIVSRWAHKFILNDLFKIHVVAAAAKSLQLYPTLCNPRDGSPPGSSAHGIFQARVLEWVAIAFSLKYINKFKISKYEQLFHNIWQIVLTYPFLYVNSLWEIYMTITDRYHFENDFLLLFTRSFTLIKALLWIAHQFHNKK